MSRIWSTIYSKLFSNISNNLTKILLHQNNYLVFSQTRLNNDSFLIAKKSFNAINVWLLLLVYFIIVSMSLLVWSKCRMRNIWTSHFEWDTRCARDRRTLWRNHVRVTVLLWICGANIGTAKCKPLLFLARHVIGGWIGVYQRTE